MVCHSALNPLFIAFLDPVDISLLQRRVRKEGDFRPKSGVLPFLLALQLPAACVCGIQCHSLLNEFLMRVLACHSLPASSCLLTGRWRISRLQSWTTVVCVPALVSWHSSRRLWACQSLSAVPCSSVSGSGPSRGAPSLPVFLTPGS